MYIFYQLNGGEETWKAIEDTKQNRSALVKKSAAFISVLSISAAKDIDYEKVKYKGDLYFDIDSKNLQEAIDVANNLVKKLRSMEVHDFDIYLSGKKGLHITVPSKVFSSGGQVKYLPYIYGKMAEKLEIAGLDFAVYSGGAGRLWRRENVVRKGINTFKVQIHQDTLVTLNEEKYKVLVSSPSTLTAARKDVSVSLPLSEMYEYCKIQVEEEEKKKSRFEFEPIPELQNLKEVPKCITNLVTKGDQKQGSNFNKAAMQLAGFIKSSGYNKQTIESLVDAMASNVTSGTYDTKKKRAYHIYSQIKRAKYDPRMGFAPSYLFSTIDPCGECILCNGELDSYYKDKNKESSEEGIDGSPVFEADNRYWVRQGKVDRPITTFLLDPVAYSEKFDANRGISERESTTFDISYEHLGEVKKYTRCLNERCWDNVSVFKKAISGIDNIIFRGGESDLQDLKHYVFSQDVQMGKITQVTRCGLATYNISATGKSILVYSEPNFSINVFGEENTHEVSDRIHSAPQAFKAKSLNWDDKDDHKIAKEICKINDSYNVAQILGWFVACHFKPHFMACEKQFPLLGLWGNAGSGKSKTAGVFAYLHGCDFEGGDAIVTCGGSTPWSLSSYVATSTSTPRILDEFNQSKIAKSHYHKIIDLLKGCWNEQSMTKGNVDTRNQKGAFVDEIRLTGPVCVLSEQFPAQEAALIQRMVIVHLSRKTRNAADPDGKSWEYVYENRERLVRIAKHLVLSALKTPKKTIRYWMDYYRDKIPSETVLDSRPHFSVRVVLTGLKLYELALKNVGIDVKEEVKTLQDSIINKLDTHIEEIVKVNHRSVVDKTIDMFGQMAVDAVKQQGENRMVSGKAYLRDDHELLIDVEGIYGAYRIYTRNLGEPAVIRTYREFETLVQEEKYYNGMVFCEELGGSRKVMSLDCEKMDKKGISVNLFEKV